MHTVDRNLSLSSHKLISSSGEQKILTVQRGGDCQNIQNLSLDACKREE